MHPGTQKKSKGALLQSAGTGKNSGFAGQREIRGVNLSQKRFFRKVCCKILYFAADPFLPAYFLSSAAHDKRTGDIHLFIEQDNVGIIALCENAFIGGAMRTASQRDTPAGGCMLRT